MERSFVVIYRPSRNKGYNDILYEENDGKFCLFSAEFRCRLYFANADNGIPGGGIMINLKHKVALVTGGSRGIGRASAIMLAKAGCDVLIHYHKNEPAASEVCRAAHRLGSRAESFPADIAQRAQVENLVEFTVHQFDKIDILINSAGIWEEAAIDRMTEEQLRRTVDTNINGVFHTITAVVPHMIEQRSGNIINVASTAGQRGEAFHSHYAASKGAIISLTKSLATELAPHNIRVNCVAPGWVDTDMSHAALVGEEREKILSLIPMGRPGTPEELAGCVLFLASDLSGFVTGEILNANGGAVLCG
jgi:3-oxoacyl-[acyl-carrier protein] reductase